MASNETAVGGIVGFLRLENDQFVRAIDQAIGKSEQLDGKQIDVQVDADTAQANAQLAATEKQVDRLDKANARVETSGRNAGRGMRPLVTAVLMLGPALIPAAAGATALAAAFGGMATAGIFAVVGIKKEMEDGTAVGAAYSEAIDGAKANLNDLARVAATNVLRPFLNAVADLNARMPQLRTQIGELSTVTGTAAAAFAGGLLNAFRALEPLMIDASVYVLRLSESFRTAMNGQGVVAFGDYIRSVFPQVLDALGSIAAAAGHLVASLAPLGLGVLTGLQLLSDLLRAIPTEVLSVLATGAGAVFLGFQTWRGITGLVDGANAALGRMNTTLALSAGAMRALHVAAGVIGVALAALSWVVSAGAEATREQQQRVNDLTDAFKASHGAIDQVIRDHQYLALQQSGAIDAAKRLGIELSTVMQAALGNGDALSTVNGIIAERIRQNQEEARASHQVSIARGKENEDLRILRDALGGANEELVKGQQGYQDYAAATQQSTTATSAAATETQRLASLYGTSASVYDQVATSQQGIADKAAAATLQMQLENNAAGLLKQSLDLLNGKTLNLASAQTQSASATLSAAAALDESNGKLKLNSKEGVAARQAIESKARADQALAEATATATGSTKAGTKSLADSKAQLEKTLKSQGLLTDEVQAYIDKIYQVPKKVPPTKLEVEKAEAERKLADFKAKLANIRDRTVTLTVREQVVRASGANSQAAMGRGFLEGNNANGSLTLASGVRAFRMMADGGVREPMIMRSMRPILWNEAPGGEAYIPLAPAKRARATAIWEETGRALGVVGKGGVEIDYERLAALMVAAMSRVQLRPVVSTAEFGRAMAARL